MMALPVDAARIPTSGRGAFGNQRATHLHNGVDIPAPAGTPVLATAPGRVVVASSRWRQGFTGYGRVVVLEHGGGLAYSLSAHLATVDVAEGQEVAAGQRIGTVGTSVFSKDDHTEEGTIGAHLHFEVADRPYPMLNTQPRVDPVAWLAGTAQGEAVFPTAGKVTVEQGMRGGVLLAFALGVLVWVAAKKR